LLLSLLIITVASDQVPEDESLVKQMVGSRKSGKGDKKKILEFLSK